jgi:hypothetical protein
MLCTKSTEEAADAFARLHEPAGEATRWTAVWVVVGPAVHTTRQVRTEAMPTPRDG